MTKDNKETNALGHSFINTEEMGKMFQLAKHNPGLVVGTAINLVNNKTNGEIALVDPSNPLVFLMEYSATLAGNAINAASSRSRELYPKLSSNQNELYHHMSSHDYVGRFATPSTATIRIALSREELLALAVETETKDIKQLMIPRGTLIRIDSVGFTTLYPILIRILPHGSFQVLYDISETDPLQVMESNVVEWWYQTVYTGDDHPGTTILAMEIDVKQIETSYHLGDTIVASDGYVKTVSYRDQFAHCRVYMNNDGVRKEIETTHSQFVYDVKKPTAVIELLEGNRLQVRIPHIYFTTSQIVGTIEIEVFTTRGAVDIDLLSIADSGRTKLDWENGVKYYTDPVDTKYTAPLSQISYIIISPNGRTYGGTNAIDFETLRDRVINHAYYAEVPITRNAITGNVELNGYELVQSVDLVPDRIYQVTKDLPVDRNGEFASGAPCTVETVSLRMSELNSSSAVINNGDRMTITPDAVFRTVDGITTIVSDEEIPSQTKLGTDTYVQRLNSLEYGYTPFHYCLDASDNEFELRAYYMDSPKINYQHLEEINVTTQLVGTVDQFAIDKLSEREYRIRIQTRGSSEFKKVDPDLLFMQLAFIPEREKDYAYVNGRYVGSVDNNFVFEFILRTDFDFSKDNEIYFNNFTMYTRDPRKVASVLKKDFMVFLGIYDLDVPDMKLTEMDKKLGEHLFDVSREKVVLSQTKLNITFGQALTRLWRNARVTTSTEVYEMHLTDVPATYDETIYQLDQDGLIVFEDGEPVVEHRKGDIIYDSQGATVYKFRTGDVKKDSFGKPILKDQKEISRFLDIFLIDGIYKFATAKPDMDYAKTIPETISDILRIDIDNLAGRLLEETSIFYLPTKTMGTIDVIVEGNHTRTIQNRFAFGVDYYVTEAAFSNYDLREAITKVTSKVINEAVKEPEMSVDTLTAMLRAKVGEEVVFIRVGRLGPNQDIHGYTVANNGGRCSVKRKLKLQADGTLKVTEDINVNFVKHQRQIRGE